jgi:UDP-2-acetamido-3-amino-2,3-dideoxy-glucuronate N-acetyltransferase
MSEFGHRLIFDDTNRAACPESGEIYELVNERVRKS